MHPAFNSACILHYKVTLCNPVTSYLPIYTTLQPAALHGLLELFTQETLKDSCDLPACKPFTSDASSSVLCMEMLRLAVTNHTVGAGDPRARFAIVGTFPALAAIQRAIFYQTGIPPQWQVLLHGDHLMFGDDDFLRRYNLRAAPAISLYKRLPNEQLLNLRVRCLRRGDLSCSFKAGLAISELKEYLARKYCMAPWKQVLMTHKAPMLEPEQLSGYATGLRMDISLSEYYDGREPTISSITVVDEDADKQQTFAVERRDTLDVLVGHLERAGMVDKDETPCLMRGYELLDNWKSFEDYDIWDGDFLFLIRDNED